MTEATFVMHVVVRVGDSPEESLRLVETEPLPPLSVGTQGAWLVRAEGVAPIHGYLFFDGKTLFVSSATPASPVMLQGRPVGSAWQPVQPNTEIVIGKAVLFVEPPEISGDLLDPSFETDDDDLPTILDSDISGWRNHYAASREESLEEASGETTAFVPPQQDSGYSSGPIGAQRGDAVHLAPPLPPPAAVSPATSVSEHYPNAPSAPVRPGTVVAPMAAPPAHPMGRGSSRRQNYDREEVTRFEPLKSVMGHGAGGAIGGAGHLPQPASAMGSGFGGAAAPGAMGAGFGGGFGGPPGGSAPGGFSAPPGVSAGFSKGPSGFGAPPGVSPAAMGAAPGFAPPPGVSPGAAMAMAAGGPPAAVHGGPPLAPTPPMPPVAGFSAPMPAPTSMAPTGVPDVFAELAPPPQQPSQPQPWHQQLKQQWKEVSLPKKLIAIMLPLAFAVYLIPIADPPDHPTTLPAAASASTPASASASAPSSPAGSGTPEMPTAANSVAPAPSDAVGSAEGLPIAGNEAGSEVDGGESSESGGQKLKRGEKTKQRQAVDAVVSGDFDAAVKLYEELVVEYPNDQAYKDALRILKSSKKK